MDSDYVRKLEEWIKAKGIKRHDANIAAFLAVRDLVKARLDEGYSATVVSDFLRDTEQIDVCYDTFLKYVHRHVRPARKRGKSRAPVSGLKTTNREVSPGGSKQGGIPSFVFNPNPKKEDLF